MLCIKKVIVAIFVIFLVLYLPIFFNMRDSSNFLFDEWPYNVLEIKSIDNLKTKKIKVAIIDTGLNRNQLSFKKVTFLSLANDDESVHGTLMANVIMDKPFYDKINEQLYDLIEFVVIDVGKDSKIEISILSKGIERAIELDVDIINISIGTYGNHNNLEEVIKKAVDKGIIVNCASGDEGTISITAMTKEFGRLVYNNYNDRITIAMPGEKIRTYLNDEEIELYGSSIATAIMTKVSIVLMADNEDFNLNKLNEIIIKNSFDIGDKGKDDKYGFGLLKVN